jgi:hypothetical protein
MQLVVYGGGWAPEYMAGCHFILLSGGNGNDFNTKCPRPGPFPVDF